MVTVIQAYRYALDPTAEQQMAPRSHCGGQRYAFNWGLARIRLVLADRWYPSSKTCSDCGAVKTKLPLRVRVFGCDECGLVLDRDLNAARNLAALVGETASGTSTASRAGTPNTPDGNPCQTHTCGQRVPPREDPHHPVRANAATARRQLPEDRELTFANTSGNG